MSNTILVTGAAGFIGMHITRRLLEAGQSVVGLDNLNSYYDPRLKKARLRVLAGFSGFHFEVADIVDRSRLAELFAHYRFSRVVHLAAQAGLRHSLIDPHAYINANLVGFANVLEGCRHAGCRHLLYASSSSVYGANTRLPLSTSDNVDHPLNLYGATKKSNELMAHAYAHLFALPATGLRFFSVYGPWGRPDMAMWIFAEAIRDGAPVRLFNGGELRRDFTYIDDVTDAVVRLLEQPATPNRTWSSDAPDAATSSAPWRVYNIGSSRPIDVRKLLRLIEKEMGKSAMVEQLPMQRGDVIETCADSAELEGTIGFRPRTPIEDGVRLFIEWFREFSCEHDGSEMPKAPT